MLEEAHGNLFSDLRELWSGGPVIPCSNMLHQYTSEVVFQQLLYVC